MRLAAVVLLPAAFFSAIEVGLRLMGFGYPSAFAVRRTVMGEAKIVNNPHFTWSFFGPRRARESTPFALEIPKGEHSFRVVVVGGSAAQGDPDPSFSLSRLLEAMLEERYPDLSLDVVNAGITAVNSHVVYQALRSCRRLDPDLVIVYLGNNEVIGPYGVASSSGPLAGDIGVIRLRLALESTRIGQLAVRALPGFGSSHGDTDGEWAGLEAFKDSTIRADNPVLERTYEHFRRNLSDARDLVRAAGVPVLLSTVAVNLGGCAPFGSANSPTLTPAELERWQVLFGRGVGLQQDGNCLEGLSAFLSALSLDDSHAELNFRLAQCALESGDLETARTHFNRARDLDTLRVRADSTINAIIRELADVADPDVGLVDVAAALGASSRSGVPTDEMFYDHVHLSFAGTYLAARALLEGVERLAPVWLRAYASGQTPRGMTGCAERLVFSPQAQLRIAYELEGRLKRPPFTYQFDNRQDLAILSRAIDDLQAFTTRDGIDELAKAYSRSLSENPGDWYLHYNLGMIHLQSLDDPAAAVKHLGAVVERQPNFPFARQFLGEAQLLSGDSRAAVASFRELLEFRPKSVEVLTKLAIALRKEGELKEAYRLLKRASGIDPSSDVVHYYLGDTLLQLAPDNRSSRGRAKAHFERALELNPEHGRARQALERLVGDR